MTAWVIVIGILLVINLIRFGVRVEYSADGLALDIVVAGHRIRILPSTPKTPEEIKAADEKKARDKARKAEKKAAKEAAKAAREEKERQKRLKSGEPEPEEEEESKKKGGALDLVLAAVPPVFDAIGTFVRHIHIDDLAVYYTSAGDDPFDTVMNFGYVSAGMGVLTPILNGLKVKNRDLRCDVDFSLDKPVIYIRAALNIAVWEILYVVFRLVAKFLSRYIKRTMNSRRRAAERT